MKQPKFRGFCKGTNRWHYGFGWCGIDYTDDFLKETGMKSQAMLYTDNGPIECDLSSMGQFTGEMLCEKEIYHGDVIKVNELTFDTAGPLPDILTVGFYGGMYQFFRNRTPLMGLHLHYLKDGEIIGNTFEQTMAKDGSNGRL